MRLLPRLVWHQGPHVDAHRTAALQEVPRASHMKRYIIHILFLISLLIAPLGLADAAGPSGGTTNKVGLVSPETKALVATNANQIMIEILTGVKSEGGKIYAGTKEALGQAYETVKKEAPEVIREFMLWRMLHHGIWIAVFTTLAVIAFYWSRRFKKLAADCPPPIKTGNYRYPWDDHGKEAFTALRYVLVAITSLLLLLGTTINLYPMLKIYAAPRVYIIEYVVKMVQPSTPHR